MEIAGHTISFAGQAVARLAPSGAAGGRHAKRTSRLWTIRAMRDDRFDRTRFRRLLADAPWIDPVQIGRSAAYLAEIDADLFAISQWLWNEAGAAVGGQWSRNSMFQACHASPPLPRTNGDRACPARQRHGMPGAGPRGQCRSAARCARSGKGGDPGRGDGLGQRRCVALSPGPAAPITLIGETVLCSIAINRAPPYLGGERYPGTHERQ